MFSSGEVDTLFNEASRVLQRSQLLLEERSRGPPPASDAPSVMPHSPSFAAALRGLRELTEFRAFLDASEEVCHRLQNESRQASPAIAKKRRRRNMYPLLRRVVDGLASVQLIRSGSGASVESLWTDGAVLSQLLVLAGLFADWLHGASKAAERGVALLQPTVTSEVMDEEGEIKLMVVPLSLEDLRVEDHLLELLSKVRVSIPEGIAEDMDEQIMRVASSLPCRSEQAVVPTQLSALLLFPMLISYSVLCASPSLTLVNVVESVKHGAAGLLPTYLTESPVKFRRACAQLVQHVVLLGMYVSCGLISEFISGSVKRVLTFTKQLFDALLTPVEVAFSTALPRAGITEDVRSGFSEPLRRMSRLWLHWERRMVVKTDTATAVCRHTLEQVWCTASYRALMVVESLARSELGVVSGRGNATVQQKRYHSMFRQSNGKVTTAILSAVTEDRQLLFEETTARSAEGHKVCRIHSGGGVTDAAAPGPSVFVYVDDGTVYMKVGRERAFRRAKSVEEVFSIFVNHPLHS